ncbi:MAG: helix-turn-helix transcriptional regulator [Acidimicrobiia bacterium]
MSSGQVKGNLDLLLLSLLAKGEAHGYELIGRLRRNSGGEFDLPEGTIYPALHRMESEGLVTSNWVRESGRRKRIYRLTVPGREALTAKQREWKRYRAGVEKVLGSLA